MHSDGLMFEFRESFENVPEPQATSTWPHLLEDPAQQEVKMVMSSHSRSFLAFF